MTDGPRPPDTVRDTGRRAGRDPTMRRASIRRSDSSLSAGRDTQRILFARDVARHPDRTAAMILLDYVGNRGLRLPREGSSTPALWARLRVAAREVGAERFFPDETGRPIVDDHTPFLRAGVPAVDLIDWSYPGHELSDRLNRLSRRSADAVGETVVELAAELRARR